MARALYMFLTVYTFLLSFHTIQGIHNLHISVSNVGNLGYRHGFSSVSIDCIRLFADIGPGRSPSQFGTVDLHLGGR